jgi:hypothetical protein
LGLFPLAAWASFCALGAKWQWGRVGARDRAFTRGWW